MLHAVAGELEVELDDEPGREDFDELDDVMELDDTIALAIDEELEGLSFDDPPQPQSSSVIASEKTNE